MLGEPKHARHDHSPRLSALPMSRPPVRGTVAGLCVTPRCGQWQWRRGKHARLGAGWEQKRETHFSGKNFGIVWHSSGLRASGMLIHCGCVISLDLGLEPWPGPWPGAAFPSISHPPFVIVFKWVKQPFDWNRYQASGKREKKPPKTTIYTQHRSVCSRCVVFVEAECAYTKSGSLSRSCCTITTTFAFLRCIMSTNAAFHRHHQSVCYDNHVFAV